MILKFNKNNSFDTFVSVGKSILRQHPDHSDHPSHIKLKYRYNLILLIDEFMSASFDSVSCSVLSPACSPPWTPGCCGRPGSSSWSTSGCCCTLSTTASPPSPCPTSRARWGATVQGVTFPAFRPPMRNSLGLVRNLSSIYVKNNEFCFS